MTEYYNIVPWYDTTEWREVYKLIYSSDIDDKQKALTQLAVWKVRCPSLPSGIESTMTLLDVSIEDRINVDMNTQLLCLAYSSAIMRFINHMLDTETAKGSSLYQAAKNLGVPDWIIDLRHDTAHSNKLPSIELLREASTIGLEWLLKNYWEKHLLCMTDYVAGNVEVNDNQEEKISALMNYCVSLSICTRNKIKNIADIPDNDLKESIVNDARDLIGDQSDFSNLKTVSISSLLNSLNNNSRKFLRGNACVHVNKALLGEESLFLSLDLLYHMGSKEFREKNTLNRHYVQCFEVLLTYLHTNKLLLNFILGLIEVTQKSTDLEKCKLAALWISEILVALRKSKQFIDKLNKSNPSDLSSKNRKEMRQLFHHWFPNEKLHGLLLDLGHPIPQELTDINFVQPIVSTYNPFLTYFIRDVLNMVEPPLPKNCSINICKLAKVISHSQKMPKAMAVSSKIYTVDDLQTNKNTVTSMEEDTDCMEISEESSEVNVSQLHKSQFVGNNVWKIASHAHNWSLLPIGFRK